LHKKQKGTSGTYIYYILWTSLSLSLPLLQKKQKLSLFLLQQKAKLQKTVFPAKNHALDKISLLFCLFILFSRIKNKTRSKRDRSNYLASITIDDNGKPSYESEKIYTPTSRSPRKQKEFLGASRIAQQVRRGCKVMCQIRLGLYLYSLCPTLNNERRQGELTYLIV
jgi:hypothetical protein